MDNKESNNKNNPFEEQLDEIKEYQKNAFNPGYYVGSGKVNLATKNLLKSPKILIIVGIIFLIPSIYNLIRNFSIVAVLNQFIQIIIGSILVVRGFMKLHRKKH